MKRHKARAQCSGVRNPAAYRKPRELATASSVDQDFNFLTRVEQAVGYASAEAEKRGIALHEQSVKPVKGEARRVSEMNQRAATILKAPPGMSRALQNKSKWDYRHKRFVWTIEWVLGDAMKVIAGCQENRTIQEAFTDTLRSNRIYPQPDVVNGFFLNFLNMPSDRSKSYQPVNEDREAAEAAQKHAVERLHFYLHRPNLPANIKCVIPISPDAVLKDVVHGRFLVEFPTIFALAASSEALPAPFITEEQLLSERHDKLSDISMAPTETSHLNGRVENSDNLQPS